MLPLSITNEKNYHKRTQGIKDLDLLVLFGKDLVETKGSKAYYDRPGCDNKYPAVDVHCWASGIFFFSACLTSSANAMNSMTSPARVSRI